MASKMAFEELQKLQKVFHELERSGDSYNQLTSKLSKGREEIEITDKQITKLLKQYRELQLIIAKVDRSLGTCMDKIVAVQDEKYNENSSSLTKRRKIENSLLDPFNYTEDEIKEGLQVAARISPDSEEPEEWILCSILKYNDLTHVFEVEDADPGDENDPNPFRKHFKLRSGRIILLTDKFKDLPKGTNVLAMFPNTTSFYPAKIIQKPTRPDFYLVKFEDDEDETGETPIRKISSKFVVPRPPPQVSLQQ